MNLGIISCDSSPVIGTLDKIDCNERGEQCLPLKMQNLNKMWKFLDDLASNDPLAYRAYILDMKNQAKTAGRIIQPGFSVEAKARNDGFKHVLNICKSKAVEKCSDSFNIPTLISEQRRITTTDGVVEFIYDAVFNDSVFDRDDLETSVLDLAASCLEDLFRVSLDKSTYKITKNSYYGPYGWNDKNGGPLSAKEWEQVLANPEKETMESLKDAQELLFGKKEECVDADPKNIEILTRPPLEAENEPLHDLRLFSQTASSSSRTLIEEIDPQIEQHQSKVCLIEEMNELPKSLDTTLSTSETSGQNHKPKLIEPQFNHKIMEDRIDFAIILPDIKSSEEIEYTPLEGTKFQVSAGNRYIFCHTLPKGYDCESATAQFILKKQKLKLSFHKVV